jgi:hypothetical protein
MSPPPTNIDGTDITGATIDGQEVQEITVDGDVVFSAAPDIPDSAVWRVNAPSLSGFNDGDTVSTWTDTIGSLNATGNGVYRPTQVGGEDAVELDGVDDKFDVSNNSALDPTLPFTVSAYVNLQTLDSFAGILIKTNTFIETINQHGWGIEASPDGSIGSIWTNGGNFQSGQNFIRTDAGVVQESTPVHIVATFEDTSTMEIYVDQSSVPVTVFDDGGGSLDPLSGPLGVGYDAYGDDRYTDGSIVRATIYNERLSASQITSDVI